VLEQKFPILKDSVRIKRMTTLCWVMDSEGDTGTEAAPLEAFLLSLCKGKYNYETIRYICIQSLAYREEDANEFMQSTLRKFVRYVDWQDQPEPGNTRYQPVDFLYNPKPSTLLSQGRFESPLEMSLVLTHTCNFRCIYCFNSSGESDSAFLSTERILELIEEAAKLQVLKCSLTGGEPLKHPGFYQVLEKMLSTNIVPYVCTNGSLIGRREAKTLAEMGLTNIQISLDATSAAMQDRMVGVPGTFPGVISAIDALIEAGLRVYVKAVLTPLNWTEAGGLIDLCHQHGVKQLVLDRFDLSSCGRGNTNLFLTREQEIEIEAVLAQKKPAVEKEMRVVAVTMPRGWKDKNEIVNCGGLRSALTILPNGDITICEKVVDNPDLIAGNVWRHSLEEIWSSERATTIVNPPAGRIQGPCLGCEDFAVCKTGCYAQSLYCTDNPYAADPRCWRVTYPNNPYLYNFTRG